MKVKRKTKKDLNLPRAPLPKQTGGAHRTKKKVLERKRKHKGNTIDPRLIDFFGWSYGR